VGPLRKQQGEIFYYFKGFYIISTFVKKTTNKQKKTLGYSKVIE